MCRSVAGHSYGLTLWLGAHSTCLASQRPQGLCHEERECTSSLAVFAFGKGWFEQGVRL